MRFPGAKPLIAVLTLLLPFWAAAQFEIPPKPPAGQQTSVYDYVGLLEPGQKSGLEQKLIRYSDSTSTQIVVAIIASTENEDIQFLGANWAHQWGIGQAREDNGVLILLARDDRRIAINTGYGVEEFLTDALSKRIIERIIIPEFREGDYYGGLDRGADAIFQVLTGQFQGKPTTRGGDDFPLESILPFIIFMVILFILASRNKRGGGGSQGGRRRPGPDLWDMIILSNMGRSSSRGGWGGSGGGGFGGGGFGGGFGGGGFGGGGASGGW